MVEPPREGYQEKRKWKVDLNHLFPSRLKLRYRYDETSTQVDARQEIKQ